jgi:hypothetical protein
MPEPIKKLPEFYFLNKGWKINIVTQKARKELAQKPQRGVINSPACKGWEYKTQGLEEALKGRYNINNNKAISIPHVFLFIRHTIFLQK